MRAPATLERWALTRDLPHSHVRLFYYDTAPGAGPARGPTLLLVHGLGDEADTWRAVMPQLARSYRVIAPDLPGFGRSPLPPRRFLSPRALARILLELVDTLDTGYLIGIGSSLGAALLHLAELQRPGAMRGLVLVDGGLFLPGSLPLPVLMMLVPGIGERRYRSLASRPEPAYASLAPYYASLEGLPAVQREFLRARVAERVASDSQRISYLATLRRYVAWTVLRGGAFERRARDLPTPALYIWGSEDRIIPVQSGRVASRRHHGSRFEVVEGAGHLPHQERPEAFLELVRAFVPQIAHMQAGRAPR